VGYQSTGVRQAHEHPHGYDGHLALGYGHRRGDRGRHPPRPVNRRIKGSRITRLGSPDDPAYEIEQEDGGRVLKLRSEVERKD
jgi:hypothetical protein